MNEASSGSCTSADGTSIRWERAGSGPALVLVDPILFSRETSPLGGLARRLTEFFTVYRYDRRGKGRSGDAPQYRPERETEDLEAVITVAGGRANVYGFSSGGVIAMRAAAAGAPITRLVVLEPPMVTDAGRGPDVRAELQGLVSAGQRAAAVRRYHESIGVPAMILDQMDTGPLEVAAHTMLYDLTVVRESSVHDWADTPCPTLVLASGGSDPRLLDWARSAASALPDGLLKTLPGAWHGIADDVLADEVTAFLRS